MIIENISKRYGDKTVLENFSVKIAMGEKVALFGENGSGKTTLFNIISGLDKQDGGKLYGYDPNDVAYLFQEDVFFEHLSLLENIVLVSQMKKHIAKEQAIALLNELDLADYAEALPSTLSGGMRKRAAIVAVFASGKKILLLDECSNALDDNMKERVIGFIKKYSSDKTVIAISHDRDFAMSFCDRYIEL